MEFEEKNNESRASCCEERVYKRKAESQAFYVKIQENSQDLCAAEWQRSSKGENVQSARQAVLGLGLLSEK